jgi:hypothetical protein
MCHIITNTWNFLPLDLIQETCYELDVAKKGPSWLKSQFSALIPWITNKASPSTLTFYILLVDNNSILPTLHMPQQQKQRLSQEETPFH